MLQRSHPPSKVTPLKTQNFLTLYLGVGRLRTFRGAVLSVEFAGVKSFVGGHDQGVAIVGIAGIACNAYADRDPQVAKRMARGRAAIDSRIRSAVLKASSARVSGRMTDISSPP